MKNRKCCGTPKGTGPHAEGCRQNVSIKPSSPSERLAFARLKAFGRAGEAMECEPDYHHKCEVCGNAPSLPVTGMCAGCSFGEASAMEDFR